METRWIVLLICLSIPALLAGATIWIQMQNRRISGWRQAPGRIVSSKPVAREVRSKDFSSSGSDRHTDFVTEEKIETRNFAEISYTFPAAANTAKEALEANTKLMTAITAALSDLGIAQKDIQTSRFSVQPVYAPPQPNTEPKLAGFNAVNDVTVTIRQIGKIGEILDRLVTAGATDVGNVEFLHADLSKTLDQAREAAIADARRKAELYARASGLTLGRIAWITEDSGYAPPMPMAAMKAVRAAPVPISTGEDTLQARITVDFEIAN